MTMTDKHALSEDLLQLADEFEQELRGNILPFWLKHAPNPNTGGFYGEVSIDLTPSPTALRSALICSRILWTFSAAYLRYQDAEYLTMARRAYEELENTFWDKKNGGLFWSVTADAQPSEPQKQIYMQTFGIYGYSEFFRATGDEVALERAKTLYALIEEHALDKQLGGYVEWLSQDWKILDSTLENYLGVFVTKSQNTHLHVLEGYTNLLRVWPDQGLKAQLQALVEVMLTKILNAETNHLALFMDAEWNVEGDEISYGHDIEGAWLFLDAAKVLGDAELIERTRKLAIKIADTTLAEGIDVDGGIYQEASAGKGLTRSDKDWWSQSEGLVGFTSALEISGDSKYLATVKRIWEFTKSNLIKENGEWHYSVNKAGEVIPSPVIMSWKCPYHNSRAMLETSSRLRKLVSQ